MPTDCLPTGPIPALPRSDNRTLFAGEDKSGDINLWVTDATADGTMELKNVGGIDG